MKISRSISVMALLVLAFAFSAFAGEKQPTNSDFMERETPRVVIIADSNPAAETIRTIIAENFDDAANIVVISKEEIDGQSLVEAGSFAPYLREVPILTARMRQSSYLVPREKHFDNEHLPIDQRAQIFNNRQPAVFRPKPEIVRMV